MANKVEIVSYGDPAHTHVYIDGVEVTGIQSLMMSVCRISKRVKLFISKWDEVGKLTSIEVVLDDKPRES